MKFRVQPVPVAVTAEAPFENDCLGRKETADVLTRLMRSIEGPCVLALDATWGKGKTTFLRMWEARLNECEFRVVMFNAWETDFANEPFLALSEELRGALEQHVDGNEAAITKLKSAASKVLQAAGPAAVQTLASSVFGPAGGQIAEGALKAFADKSMSQYGQAKAAIKEFNGALQAAAGTLTKESEEVTPLVVIIDELDRCRPSYAVELLEVLKHLYAVDGVVFVLALNRNELAHSVRALYGAEFDAAGYLRRFIDIDIRLPDADREKFINTRLDTLQSQIQGIHGGYVKAGMVVGIARAWLHRFFGGASLDLRTLEQGLHRLGLMLAMLGGHDALIKTASFVLILRTIEPDLYYEFVGDRATDEDVANALFGRMEGNYRASTEGQNLEAEIIMAAAEDDLARGRDFTSTNSRLLGGYQRLGGDTGAETARTPEWEHAATILNFIAQEHEKQRSNVGYMPFRDTVARLEMLSGDLGHDSS